MTAQTLPEMAQHKQCQKQHGDMRRQTHRHAAQRQAAKHKQRVTPERPIIDKATIDNHRQRTGQSRRRIQPAKTGIGQVEHGAYLIAVKRDEKSLAEIRQPHHQKAEQQKAVMRANEREIIHLPVLESGALTGNRLITQAALRLWKRILQAGI